MLSLSRFLNALLLAGLLAAPAGAQIFRLREHTFHHDGLERQYLVYTPDGARKLKGKRPLVLMLAGGGGTHRATVRGTKERWNELADRDGFYVVYPNPVRGMWDFGEGRVSESLKQRVDDLGFFTGLLERLLRDFPVDPAQVFATGISRGGQASYFLACKLPGKVRAIAPVTMPLPRFLEDDCKTGPPVGVVVLNGTEDPLVPYDGGQITLLRQKRGEVLSTDETLRLFRQRNGCGAGHEKEMLPDRIDDGTRVEKTSWKQCTGAPVSVYRIEGGGHTWPGGTQYMPTALIGRVTRDIDGAEEIWSFFSGFLQ